MMVMELPPHTTLSQPYSVLLFKTILRLVCLDEKCTVNVYNLWRRYLPLPDLSVLLGPDARAKKVARTS